MELSYERLISFDLIETAEAELGKDFKKLADFLVLQNKIDNIDQFIKESPSFPGSTDKIIRGELVSVVGATLSIEGTVLEKEEIEESFRKADHEEVLQQRELEAENSRKVYILIRELINHNEGEFIFSEPMVKQMHAYFTDGMNYLSNVPGQYRTNYHATFGVPRRTGLCKTLDQVEIAMSNLMVWLNNKGEGIIANNPLARAIMTHYYLTEIHPFGDGNGRTARAMEALVLYANGINRYCFWSLANFWNLNKELYFKYLGDIRRTCNPWDFVLWGMEGYLSEITEVKKKVLKKVKQLMLLDYVKYRLANKKDEKIKFNQRIVDVMQLLIDAGRVQYTEFLNNPSVSALYSGVTSSTKWRDFKKLTNSEIVRITKDDDVVYIEPNFNILDTITYHVK